MTASAAHTSDVFQHETLAFGIEDEDEENAAVSEARSPEATEASDGAGARQAAVTRAWRNRTGPANLTAEESALIASGHFPISCGDISAIMHLAKFGSHCKGACMELNDGRMVSVQDLIVAARKAGQHYTRCVKFGRFRLERLMPYHFRSHSTHCQCEICTDGVKHEPPRFFGSKASSEKQRKVLLASVSCSQSADREHHNISPSLQPPLAPADMKPTQLNGDIAKSPADAREIAMLKLGFMGDWQEEVGSEEERLEEENGRSWGSRREKTTRLIYRKRQRRLPPGYFRARSGRSSDIPPRLSSPIDDPSSDTKMSSSTLQFDSRYRRAFKRSLNDEMRYDESIRFVYVRTFPPLEDVGTVTFPSGSVLQPDNVSCSDLCSIIPDICIDCYQNLQNSWCRFAGFRM